MLASDGRCIVLCDHSTGVPLLHVVFPAVEGQRELHIPVPRETPEPVVEVAFEPSGCNCVIRVGQYFYKFEKNEREVELKLVGTRHVPHAPDGTCLGLSDGGMLAIGTGEGRVFVYNNFCCHKPIADFVVGTSPVAEIVLHSKAIFVFLMSGDMWEGRIEE